MKPYKIGDIITILDKESLKPLFEEHCQAYTADEFEEYYFEQDVSDLKDNIWTSSDSMHYFTEMKLVITRGTPDVEAEPTSVYTVRPVDLSVLPFHLSEDPNDEEGEIQLYHFEIDIQPRLEYNRKDFSDVVYTDASEFKEDLI